MGEYEGREGAYQVQASAPHNSSMLCGPVRVDKVGREVARGEAVDRFVHRLSAKRANTQAREVQ